MAGCCARAASGHAARAGEERDELAPPDLRDIQSPRPRWPAVAVAAKQRNELASFIHHVNDQMDRDGE
jgi:hypothetical protein